MSLVPAFAPASITAVCPSRLIVAPGCGPITSEIRGSADRIARARSMTCPTAGSVTGRSAVITICSADEALPPK